MRACLVVCWQSTSNRLRVIGTSPAAVLKRLHAHSCRVKIITRHQILPFFVQHCQSKMRLAITLQNQSYLADCAFRLVGVSDLTRWLDEFLFENSEEQRSKEGVEFDNWVFHTISPCFSEFVCTFGSATYSIWLVLLNGWLWSFSKYLMSVMSVRELDVHRVVILGGKQRRTARVAGRNPYRGSSV